MSKATFADFSICQWMILLRKLQLMTLIYIFRWKECNFNISETKRASTDTWTDFKHLVSKQHYSFLKCKWSPRCSCRFARSCTALAVELLRFIIKPAKSVTKKNKIFCCLAPQNERQFHAGQCQFQNIVINDDVIYIGYLRLTLRPT